MSWRRRRKEHLTNIVEHSSGGKSGRKIDQVANQVGEGGVEEEDWRDTDCGDKGIKGWNEESKNRGARGREEPSGR